MKIDAKLVEKKGQQLLSLEQNGRTKKHRRRLKKPNSPVIQKLFQTCKEVFAECAPGKVPPEGDILRLKSVIDNLKPSDVGLKEDMPYFKSTESEGSGSLPPVTYLHVYECDRFSIGIFCFPPSAVIPLHNHPGMTVFSKILFGSLHIKSYDWAKLSGLAVEVGEAPEGQSDDAKEVKLAELKANAVFTAPCDTSILYPAAGGNMHRFTGVTSCAVLDVLGPPYCDVEGRPCTYYQEFPYDRFPGLRRDGSPKSILSYILPELLMLDICAGEQRTVPDAGKQYAWLRAKDSPDDFVVVGAKYRGPKVVEHR